MAKTLDFNRINRPVLQLIMPDEDKTVIKVTNPSEGLIEELEELLPEFQAMKDNTKVENYQVALDMAYDLAARLINYNLSHVTVTADDLRRKYNWDFKSLGVFFDAYEDFIKEIENVKN